MFGGCFDLSYSKQNNLNKSILRYTSLKSDALFVETDLQRNFIKEYFHNENRIYKFPNCRKSVNLHSYISKTPFVFIGQVKKEKGLDFIIKANEILPDNQKIHIYGPIWDEEYSNKLGDSYKGLLPSEEVVYTIAKYKYLVLPTYWYGEGHPGVIIEAMSIGKPIIASNHRAIPELVSEKNGFLFDPYNFNNFISVLQQSVDNPNYQTLCNNSMQHFNSCFESDNVHYDVIRKIRKFITNIQSLVVFDFDGTLFKNDSTKYAYSVYASNCFNFSFFIIFFNFRWYLLYFITKDYTPFTLEIELII